MHSEKVFLNGMLIFHEAERTRACCGQRVGTGVGLAWGLFPFAAAAEWVLLMTNSQLQVFPGPLLVWEANVLGYR